MRSWSSSHRGTEYRLIMAAVCGLCALAVVSAVVPIVEYIVGAALVAFVAVAVVVAVVRRELRIRYRLADTDGTWHAPRPAAAAAIPPVPAPLPSSHLTLLRPVEDGSRRAVAPGESSAGNAGRPATRAGGAA